MTKIEVFDTDANTLEELAKENDTFEAFILDAIMYALKDNDIDIREYI